MGLCLYLALMRHLLGDSFTFAVLDDVLMSVDVGHRREVCNLLREKFPTTQFILTTHDPIWLRLMETIGLVDSKGRIHFRKWSVSEGPTEWDDRDIWGEIDFHLKQNNVRAAAGLLRYYLEYFFSEACHRLRARVEFRLDSRFELGDLSTSAISRLRQLLKEAKAAAQSWVQKEALDKISALEAELEKKAAASNVEQWQINPAIHYNAWENLDRNDFSPVVSRIRDLLICFSCAQDVCRSPLYVMPERGTRENLRCNCGHINFNLVAKPKAKG